jgi:hypothetical protein
MPFGGHGHRGSIILGYILEKSGVRALSGITRRRRVQRPDSVSKIIAPADLISKGWDSVGLMI